MSWACPTKILGHRRLASSFEALKRTLNGRLICAGGITEEDASLDEASEMMSGEEVVCLATEAIEAETANERERITNLLRRIAQSGTDSKAHHLPAPKFAYNSN